MPVEVAIVLVELVVVGAVLTTNRHSRRRIEPFVLPPGPQPSAVGPEVLLDEQMWAPPPVVVPEVFLDEQAPALQPAAEPEVVVDEEVGVPPPAVEPEVVLDEEVRAPAPAAEPEVVVDEEVRAPQPAVELEVVVDEQMWAPKADTPPALPAAVLFEVQPGATLPAPLSPTDLFVAQPGATLWAPPPPPTALFELVLPAVATTYQRLVPRNDAAAGAFEATGSAGKETICFVTGLAPEACACQEHQRPPR